MLATSYGGRATLALGDAALDRGHYLEALEHYTTVRDVFPDKDLHTPELEVKIAVCRRKLGDRRATGEEVPVGWTSSPSSTRDGLEVHPTGGQAAGKLTAQQQAALRQVLEKSKQDLPPFHSQLASAPHVACDDYTLLPPTADPMALRAPVWKHDLPGTRHDFFVYSQPVVTGNSVIYRHKNIVYCHSIFTGELRWKNDLGGRVTWQNWEERQYPQEDLLVQDGLVFTAMHKAGPTLVALDETTGQLKWAFGPMVASTKEESQMRFESAPAGGPKTVYASYVLDDIEGDTHTDTEYGLMAFESTTGRMQWRRPVCRMRPGEFSAQFAERRRNLVRSFTSPPLYAQGTVYHNTNAGAVAAVDAFSGQVKWVMRYPYYALPYSVHDATRQFGEGRLAHYSRVLAEPHRPMFWSNQRPLLIGERLFVLPVDSPMMFSIDRRTGKVL
jgi:outer membrane protein assembly factor BamB